MHVFAVLGFITVFVLFFVVPQRFAIYSLYAPMTKRPWSEWERFQFKWFPWFPWARLDNEYVPPVDPGYKGPPLPPRSKWYNR